MIRAGHPQKEGLLQVSKWLKIQVLLDAAEMKELFEALGQVYFVVVSEPTREEELVVTEQSLLEKYEKYVTWLQEGKKIAPQDFRKPFSTALSQHLDAFYAMQVGEKWLAKPLEPVIQLQAHHFIYSALDQKFHPQACGEGSISWGLQFSYPQLFLSPKTKQIIKLRQSDAFLNTQLFLKLQRWMRAHTLPTPFIVDGVKIHVPIRIGKKALPWISSHPDLKEKQLRVGS